MRFATRSPPSPCSRCASRALTRPFGTPRPARADAGRTWLEVPGTRETFFYRKLLEAVRYLQPGPWQTVDPFGPQKRQQEAEALARLAANSEQLAGLDLHVLFETLLHSALWGNRADLSNLTVKEQALAGPLPRTKSTCC